MGIEMDALKVSEGIYIQYDRLNSDERDDCLKIVCNYCGSTDMVFFQGVQEDASDAGNPWLQDAIIHLTTKHADRM